MQHKAKILQYYNSGRYECDYHFRLELKEVLQELNLYHWIPKVQEQLNTLKRITELTQINSKSLEEDYDDEEGVCQTYKIRQLISQLNSKDIPNIIQECQSLKWQSYSSKLCKQLQGKEQYSLILERIHTTIHSQQFRIDSMLFTAFFQQINSGKLTECLQAYSQTIQYFLNFLMKSRSNFQVLIESSQYSNITEDKRVKNYVGTLYFVMKTCLRFCEIVKILTGKNNLSLKFTVVKKQLQKLIKKYPKWKFQNDKEDLFSCLHIYKHFLQTMQPINKNLICKWCFKSLKKEQECHEFCEILINKKERIY